MQERESDGRVADRPGGRCRDGYSYDEIATDMGYANRSGAWRLVTNALKDTVDAVAEDHLQLELDRLDALQAPQWGAAVSGDLGAARFVLRIVEDRIRLLKLGKAAPSPKSPHGLVCPVDELEY